MNAIAAAGQAALLGILPSANATAVQALYDSQVNLDDDWALDIGVAQAEAVLNARAFDGSAPVPPYNGSLAAGAWRPTPTAFANGLNPQWASLRPFAIQYPSQFRLEPPPTLSSAAYKADYDEVLSLGNATSATRTPEQTATATFWRGNIEIYFFQIVQQVVAKRKFLDAVRYFAVTSIAAADARIAVWDSKYAYSTWRPVTAIPLGNSVNFAVDPFYASLIPTPPHPEYASGHTVTGAAVAEALLLLMGQNKFTYTITSYTLGDEVRTYNNFVAANVENAESRILGGVHFRFSNVAAVPLGIDVGRVAYQYIYGQNAKVASGSYKSLENYL